MVNTMKDVESAIRLALYGAGCTSQYADIQTKTIMDLIKIKKYECDCKDCPYFTEQLDANCQIRLHCNKQKMLEIKKRGENDK